MPIQAWQPYNFTPHNGFVGFLLWSKGAWALVTARLWVEGCVWECVYCTGHMCYVISACQLGVSGINKQAIEQESDTHTYTHTEGQGLREYERDQVSRISLQCTWASRRVYTQSWVHVLKAYLMSIRLRSALIPYINHVSSIFSSYSGCWWDAELDITYYSDCLCVSVHGLIHMTSVCLECTGVRSLNRFSMHVCVWGGGLCLSVWAHLLGVAGRS